MADVAETLEERGREYGDWAENALLADKMFRAVEYSDNYIGDDGWMPPYMTHSIRMILVKIARICNGNPFNMDNWHDIQGYAKLAEDLGREGKGKDTYEKCLADERID